MLVYRMMEQKIIYQSLKILEAFFLYYAVKSHNIHQSCITTVYNVQLHVLIQKYICLLCLIALNLSKYLMTNY